MIKPIITYPTAHSQAFDGIVRHYDETLHALLDDLKDTINAHNLHGLAAYQIGSCLNVIVIKDKDDFIEIINPVIITKDGSLTSTESTHYYPNLIATTKRYQSIKLMYEDRTGKQQFLTAQDNLAILIQRKTDFLLGSDFRIRMSSEEKERFDTKLANSKGTLPPSSCPTSEPSLIKNILLLIVSMLILGGIGAMIGLFSDGAFFTILKRIEVALMLLSVIVIILYFFLAQIEGKKYRNCTSCQIGNILGTTMIHTLRLSLLGVANYFIFW